MVVPVIALVRMGPVVRVGMLDSDVSVTLAAERLVGQEGLVGHRS
jgi:hypothetical protein